MKAFPIPSYVNASGETHDVQHQGMELRDYFAAKIMQGFVQGMVEIDKNDDQKTSEVMAFMSYKFADEMIKARGNNVAI